MAPSGEQTATCRMVAERPVFRLTTITLAYIKQTDGVLHGGIFSDGIILCKVNSRLIELTDDIKPIKR